MEYLEEKYTLLQLYKISKNIFTISTVWIQQKRQNKQRYIHLMTWGEITQ